MRAASTEQTKETEKRGQDSGARPKALVRAVQLGIAVLYPWPRAKTLKNGVRLMIDPKKNWIDFNLAVKSQYEEGTLGLIDRLLPEQGVIIDVGANSGVMSVFAARKAGKAGLALAFEPDNKNFARLTWAREANSVPQLLPFPLALGHASAMAPLRRAPSGDGGLSSLAELEGFVEHSSVAIVSMDDVLSVLPVSRVDVIKIDVEGAEKAVIDGAQETLRRFKPAVIMEMVTDAGVAAGEQLVGWGYVALHAGAKEKPLAGKLARYAPQKLSHNNMLFVHATKIDALSSSGLEIA